MTFNFYIVKEPSAYARSNNVLAYTRQLPLKTPGFVIFLFLWQSLWENQLSFCLLLQKVSLSSPWSQTHYDLSLSLNPLASASKMPDLQVQTTTHSWEEQLKGRKFYFSSSLWSLHLWSAGLTQVWMLWWRRHDGAKVLISQLKQMRIGRRDR